MALVWCFACGALFVVLGRCGGYPGAGGGGPGAQAEPKDAHGAKISSQSGAAKLSEIGRPVRKEAVAAASSLLETEAAPATEAALAGEEGHPRVEPEPQKIVAAAAARVPARPAPTAQFQVCLYTTPLPARRDMCLASRLMKWRDVLAIGR